VRATDQMLARVAAEIEEKQQFIDGLVESAEKDGRDLSSQEMELVTRSRTRMGELEPQLETLRQTREISHNSRARIAEIAKFMGEHDVEKPREVEYRSAGEYVIDRWRSGLGMQDAAERLDLYHRAAAHQKTSDNPGLIPTPILGPVINFIDANRVLVTQLGPRQLPGQTWSRPKVTQHTSVGLQPAAGDAAAEKAELVSQKMTITKLTATAITYGGYVNVSRQDIDFSTPGVLDIVINDLAAQYAIQTEAAAFTTFDAAATAGIAIPTGAATAAAVMTSLWDAVAKIFTASKGAGRVFAITGPDMLPILGPVFPPYNAQNAVSPGLMAGDFGTGLVGSISGIPLYVSAGCGTLRMLVVSTAGAEVYEDRIGSLQVVEPSVLGLQVAYAGYFTPMVVDATSIVKVVKTP
jgi:HK97 family phage major capsid protein